VDKVKIAAFFEDLFGVPRVDVVVLPEAPVMLALEIVGGELLFARDDRCEAEYQLYIMRLAAELAPFEKMKTDLILEMRTPPEKLMSVSLPSASDGSSDEGRSKTCRSMTRRVPA
jgi:hypothetical protein